MVKCEDTKKTFCLMRLTRGVEKTLLGGCCCCFAHNSNRFIIFLSGFSFKVFRSWCRLEWVLVEERRGGGWLKCGSLEGSQAKEDTLKKFMLSGLADHTGHVWRAKWAWNGR